MSRENLSCVDCQLVEKRRSRGGENPVVTPSYCHLPENRYVTGTCNLSDCQTSSYCTPTRTACRNLLLRLAGVEASAGSCSRSCVRSTRLKPRLRTVLRSCDLGEHTRAAALQKLAGEHGRPAVHHHRVDDSRHAAGNQRAQDQPAGGKGDDDRQPAAAPCRPALQTPRSGWCASRWTRPAPSPGQLCRAAAPR